MKDPDWSRASEANQIIRISTGRQHRTRSCVRPRREQCERGETYSSEVSQPGRNTTGGRYAIKRLTAADGQRLDLRYSQTFFLFLFHGPVLRTNWYFSLIGPRQKETTFHLIRHPLSKDLDKKRPSVICLLSGSGSVFDSGLLWGRESARLLVELVETPW